MVEGEPNTKRRWRGGPEEEEIMHVQEQEGAEGPGELSEGGTGGPRRIIAVVEQ